jgi:DeoR family transcriptional regulator, L-fucose operon activator
MSLLAHQRQHEILRRLEEGGSVRTTTLARLFKVSDETIRNDFAAMENEGRLARIHGGAIRPPPGRRDLPLVERLAINREEKSAIARAAARRVRANETIFLDASSTALTLAECLPEIPLTILTNAQNVVNALAGRPHCDIICTGGHWDERSRSFVGVPAEEGLRRYHIHRMFFSGNAFDLERGVSEVNARQAVFKERVLPLAEEVCLLADHTKLGRKSAFFFAPTARIGLLLTDRGAPAGFLAAAAAAGLAVVVADP